MNEKRFTIKPQDDYFGITDNNTADKVNVINGIRTEIEAEWLCDLLNELNDENEQLKKEKDRYKILSEIRQENINNRILTIKEFINNCSDKKVKETLKQLFYSEVKEYDLSTQNRKLLHENEQLKQSYKEFEDECQSTFNAMNRKQNDLYRKNFKLKEENEQLKQEIKGLEKEIIALSNGEADWLIEERL